MTTGIPDGSLYTIRYQLQNGEMEEDVWQACTCPYCGGDASVEMYGDEKTELFECSECFALEIDVDDHYDEIPILSYENKCGFWDPLRQSNMRLYAGMKKIQFEIFFRPYEPKWFEEIFSSLNP